MNENKALADRNETPDDVASLYTWANLHGAKYRDFSAARAQSREKARQRAQAATEEQQVGQSEDEAAQKAVEMQRAFDAAQAAEEARRAMMAETSHQAIQAPVSNPEQVLGFRLEDAGEQEASRPVPAIDLRQLYPEPSAQASYRVPASMFRTGMPGQDEPAAPAMSGWAQPEMREAPVRPAWLTTEPPIREHITTQQIPVAPEGTLQGARDRLASRWFALQGVFEGESAPVPVQVQEPRALPVPSRAPVLAVFSLAGGVGKTSLVATLGRALASKGERVLLVDTASFGVLPFYFGARDQRIGVLRTFNPPDESAEAPVQLVTYEPETMGTENAPQEMLSAEVMKLSQGSHRVLVDLSTASGATTRRLLRLTPTVLVPVVPDMNSVVSISSIDSFFQHNLGPMGKPVQPYYVLNHFDSSHPLHLDVREVLREQLGDRLLPISIRRASEVSEALAEGMTVLDYAPTSAVAEDYAALAGWLKNLAAPASQGYRGVRWSER